MRIFLFVILFSFCANFSTAQVSVQYGFNLQPAVSIYHYHNLGAIYSEPKATLNGGADLLLKKNRLQLSTGLFYYLNKSAISSSIIQDIQRFSDHRLGLPLVLGYQLNSNATHTFNIELGFIPSLSLFQKSTSILNFEPQIDPRKGFVNSTVEKFEPWIKSDFFQAPLVLGLSYQNQLNNHLSFQLQPRVIFQWFGGSESLSDAFYNKTFTQIGLSAGLLFSCNGK